MKPPAPKTVLDAIARLRPERDAAIAVRGAAEAELARRLAVGDALRQVGVGAHEVWLKYTTERLGAELPSGFSLEIDRTSQEVPWIQNRSTAYGRDRASGWARSWVELRRGRSGWLFGNTVLRPFKLSSRVNKEGPLTFSVYLPHSRSDVFGLDPDSSPDWSARDEEGRRRETMLIKGTVDDPSACSATMIRATDENWSKVATWAARLILGAS